MLKVFFKDPLFQLLLIGILLYLLFSFFNTEEIEQVEVFQISQAEVDRYVDEYRPQDPEPITVEERRQLIEAYVNSELLYQEAIRLGLEHDAMIRDRMAQKTRFYMEGQFVPPNADDKAIKEYFDKNQENYLQQPRVSFEHRVLQDGHGAPLSEWFSLGLSDEQLLERISSISISAPLSTRFDNATFIGLKEIFGDDFISVLGESPVGRWIGPVQSPFGEHVVKIDHRQLKELANFEQAREQVKEDYIRDSRETWMAEQLESLQQQYGINLEDYMKDE